jgi:membrane protein YqaA with SNARE-associated domain
LAGWLDRWGTATALGWGFAEATLFFVVPDAAVGAVALLVPRRAWRAALAAVMGAVVGGIALWIGAEVAGQTSRSVIDGVPAIPSSMFEDVRRSLATHGGAAMLIAPFSGIPYKVYALEMSLAGWSLPSLVGWTLLGRSLRLGPVAVALAAAGWLARRIGVPERVQVALYVAGWAALYATYWWLRGF